MLMPVRRLVLALLAGSVLAGAATAAEERKKAGGLSFTQMPTLNATIVRPGGARGVITAEAGIDTPDPALKARADLLTPRLRDAYAQVLTTFAAQIPPGTAPDLDVLAQRLQQATDRVVGRPGSHLLIGAVVVN